MQYVVRAAILWAIIVSHPLHASEKQSEGMEPFTIEYYYKVKWGYFDEWLDLYKRNHWPVLQAEMASGHIVGYKMELPHTYLPEPHRWNARVSITWRDALVAHNLVDKGRPQTLARLFPNKLLHEKEEQRRFEILEGVWQVEPETVDTADWRKAGSK